MANFATLLARIRSKASPDAALHRNFAWALSGNVIYSACQWAIMIVLAKLGSLEQVGEYALGVAISMPILVFANLQLRAMIAGDVRNRYRFSQYLGFRFASLAIALAIVSAMVVWRGYTAETGLVVVLIGAGQALEYLSDGYYGLMQKNDRMDRISRSLVMKGPLSLVMLCGGLYFTGNLLIAVSCLALARALIFAFFDCHLNYRRGAASAGPEETNVPSFAPGVFLGLLRATLPLGITTTLIALNTNIPRYFIEGSWTKRELGIFSAMASLIGAGNLVMNAVGQSAFLPMAQAHAANNRKRFRMLVSYLLGIATVLGMAAVVTSALWGRPILTHVFRPEYAESTGAFVVLMVASGLSFLTYGLGSILTSIGIYGPQIGIVASATVATLIGSAWFIPGGGILGASEALLAASVVQVMVGSAILARVLMRGGSVPSTKPALVSQH